MVASINAEAEQDLSLVRFSFMAPVDLRTFRDGKSYAVDIVKDEASTPARNRARGKPMPMANMEAMPQLSVTAESMTVAPPPAVAAAQTQTGEKSAGAPREAIAAAVAPQQQMPESRSLRSRTLSGRRQRRRKASPRPR